MTTSVAETSSNTTDFATAAINQGLGADEKIGFLRLMVRIRRFEQISLVNYKDGKMGGFLHLYIGQESVAVGTVSLLRRRTTTSSPPTATTATRSPSAWA